MTQISTPAQGPLTLPVRLAIRAMRWFPRHVSPDDTEHAAFFEKAHLKGMSQEQIHKAMHAAAHDRRAAEEANPFLELFFSGAIGTYFKGKEVLDFGCAFGGTAIAWERMYGAKSIAGFDVSPYFIEGAQRYAKHVGSTADFKQGVGEHAPFPDGSFDTVIAIDVFEHVYNVGPCLKECWRMLKPDGNLILVFPPFYHPFEHHIKVSRTPFVHWIFSGETIRKALNYLLSERGPQYEHFQAEPNPNYRIPDLNGITCRAARKLIKQQGWKVVRNECYGVPRVGRGAQTRLMRGISAFSSLFARMPVLEEVFLDRVAVILQRDAASTRG